MSTCGATEVGGEPDAWSAVMNTDTRLAEPVVV
jgi:hypothetical protein